MRFKPETLRIAEFGREILENDLGNYMGNNPDYKQKVTDEYVVWMEGLHKYVEPKIIEEMNGYSDSEYEQIFEPQPHSGFTYLKPIEDTDMFVEHSNEYIKQNPNELFAEIMRTTVLVDLFIDIGC